MVLSNACPRGGPTAYKKNGHIHNGKQNHQCQDCGCQFVQHLEQYLIGAEKRDLIERLLLECLSLRGLGRTVKVGLNWLLGFILTCFEALPAPLHVQSVTGTQDVMIQRLEGGSR
jgi:transposase-like protein